ncbi:hypothetical protein OG373_10625 [Streptomyces avidinii]|uniref:hypothetical protein n=1 Tax=Streptomyces avidinii TaxID=1895 RepID=UPI003865EC4F|nr:hypothetical protein OG373_10625 [Streptomyces avidinii]
MNRAAEYDTVARLWQDHMDTPFPAAQRGAVLPARPGGEEQGVEMVLLDTYTAGGVITWLGNGGSLDERHHRILRSCIEDLDHVLPLLEAPEDHAYYRRLREVARLVSDTA